MDLKTPAIRVFNNMNKSRQQLPNIKVCLVCMRLYRDVK